MNAQRIIELAKEWLTHDDGQDYYTYDYQEHWWGDQEALEGFAKQLLEEMK